MKKRRQNTPPEPDLTGLFVKAIVQLSNPDIQTFHLTLYLT